MQPGGIANDFDASVQAGTAWHLPSAARSCQRVNMPSAPYQLVTRTSDEAPWGLPPGLQSARADPARQRQSGCQRKLSVREWTQVQEVLPHELMKRVEVGAARPKRTRDSGGGDIARHQHLKV